jgi:hypothetical protein
MQTAETLPVEQAPVTSDTLLALLQNLHWDSPIAVANKMNFLNMYCDADFVAVSMGGLITEYEIKVSRSDFLRDRKKLRHEIYSMDKPGELPNRFFYATAPGIVTAEDIPSWAGWMEYEAGELRVRRQAPKMTHAKQPPTILLRLARAMRSRGAAMHTA